MFIRFDKRVDGPGEPLGLAVGRGLPHHWHDGHDGGDGGDGDVRAVTPVSRHFRCKAKGGGRWRESSDPATFCQSTLAELLLGN